MSFRHPGRSTCHARAELSLEGETVTVRVRNYPPNVAGDRHALRSTGCDRPALRRARPDGAARRSAATARGSAQLAVTPGPVGRELRVRASRGDDCGISVASDDVFARGTGRADLVRRAARCRLRPDPAGRRARVRSCSSSRLPPGFSCRTDWAAVGEAAAPEIDDAEYADLDAIIAALPPEEDEQPNARHLSSR